MDANLKTLVGKLNECTRSAATRAAGICVGLGQYEVDVEHVFLALLEQDGTDLACVLRQCDISTTRVEAELRAEVSRFATGATRTPVFARQLPLLLEHAWLLASLSPLQPCQIRSGHLLLALLSEPSLAQRATKHLAMVPRERLKLDFDALTARSREAQVQGVPTVEERGRATPALDQFTSCLTAAARAGKLDPVIGRDAEIRQLIDILLRRRQNNPILTGEAGVGKTAVVEGLALRIAAGEVPQVLQGVELHNLDMGLLQAGASVKGEFESRLKNVIQEVKQSPHAIILFIDEAHTIIGAGGAAGQNDAANLLKPALARGELRTIAATTWGEYKRYFEKDPALARRFQVVKVEEPDEATACAMLRAMAPLMERHFNVRILDEAVADAVRLSQRYISGRQLPDKAVSVLDTACAKVALGQNARPALVEEGARVLEAIDVQLAVLEREAASGMEHGARMHELRAERLDAAARKAQLEQRWQQEQGLCSRILAARSQGDHAGASALGLELQSVQGETALVPLEVNGALVASVIANWTGIPLGRMLKDDAATVMKLDGLLNERVLGQNHAGAAVAQRVRTARANLDDPGKPQGVFLFVGPSGVGKTETAIALAELLYGGERKLVTINMSEYQEAHSVSGLKGSPPGYVGYGEGGVLTEAVRRNPYSVVLLDEFEKAHPDVLELFYQVFDKGRLDDSEGRSVDFKNTIIIATSNAGSAQLMQACLNQSELPSTEALSELLRPVLIRQFKAALLGRMTLVPFYPLADTTLADIIRKKLDELALRIRTNHHAEFVYEDSLVEAVLARCTEVDSGARNVEAILASSLLPEVADQVLAAMASGGALLSVRASATKAGKFTFILDQV